MRHCETGRRKIVSKYKNALSQKTLQGVAQIGSANKYNYSGMEFIFNPIP